MKVKPKLWLMCGIPGSGKSYFAKNTLITDSSWAYISRDEIRFELLEDSDEYFAKESQVFIEFANEINYCLSSGIYNNVIADATHLNFNSRMKLLRSLLAHGIMEDIDIIPVVMQTPYLTCIERNSSREGRKHVPEDVIKNMHKSFSHPKNDNFNYTAILEVF